jgi:hypothetical protein
MGGRGGGAQSLKKVKCFQKMRRQLFCLTEYPERNTIEGIRVCAMCAESRL